MKVNKTVFNNNYKPEKEIKRCMHFPKQEFIKWIHKQVVQCLVIPIIYIVFKSV